jgi:hypothetical protein
LGTSGSARPGLGGPTPQVKIQRAYRAQLKAAGKVVKLVDADFDPGQMQALVVELRDNLHNALVQLELRTQDVERLEARNRFLEAELVRLERELTNKAKDAIVARQQGAKAARSELTRSTTKAERPSRERDGSIIITVISFLYPFGPGLRRDDSVLPTWLALLSASLSAEVIRPHDCV